MLDSFTYLTLIGPSMHDILFIEESHWEYKYILIHVDSNETTKDEVSTIKIILFFFLSL